MTKTVRGIRNNNPGNIETGAPWQGLMPRHDMSPAQRGEDRFCVFASPTYGIRAIARVLITYQDKRRAKDGSAIDTVQEIIDRWAPPEENDTSNYVRSVRRAMGQHPDKPLGVNVHDFKQMLPLVKAIIRHENGVQPYTDAQITKGLVLAGIEPPAKPDKVGQGRTMTAVKIGTGVSVTGAVVEAVTDLEPAMPFLQMAGRFLPYIIAGVAVIALLRVGYARWDDHRKGLR